MAGPIGDIDGLTPLDAQAAGATPRRRGRIGFWIAVGWLAFIVFVAVFAGVLPLHRYDSIVNNLDPRTAPRFSFHEPLGTDTIGRSITSRLAYGARESLLIGVVGASIAMSIGLLVGITAGYFHGGKVDEATSIFLDVFLAFPPLILLLAIASVGRRDVLTVGVGLSLLGIPTFARLARANALALAKRDSVLAARAMGAGHLRIMVRELLPSVVLSLSAYAFIYLAFVIVIEGALAFLGLSIPPPNATWGGMVNDGRAFLQTQPYLVFIPAACLIFTVVSLTVVGDRARRQFDVRGSALD